MIGKRDTKAKGGAVFLVLAIMLLAMAAMSLAGCSSPQSKEDAVSQIEFTEQDETMVDERYRNLAISHDQDDRLVESTGSNSVTPEEKVVYLTFDDGPSGQTQKILDTLDKYGIKATWFVSGNAVNLDAIPGIWEKGHQIGLHSNTHNYEKIYASTQAFFDDMTLIGNTVEGYIGHFPTLLRFPGGSHSGYTDGKVQALTEGIAKRGWHYYDWNVTIGDSTTPMSSVEVLVDNIKRGADGCHSCCVLMHDFDGKSTTADALEQVIEYFIDQGFKFDYLTADSYGYHF